MMIEKQYPSKPLPPLPYFYPLPITGNRLKLTKEVLDEHYRLNKKTRVTVKDHLARFVGFKNGVAEAVVIDTKRQDYIHFYFTVTLEAVWVSCECQMPKKVICDHLYIGITKLMLSLNSVELRQYYWPGYTNTSKNEYVNIGLTTFFSSLKIEPKDEFGNLYLPGFGFKGFTGENFKERQIRKTDPFVKYEFNKQTIGFCLLYNSRDRSTSFPSVNNNISAIA